MFGLSAFGLSITGNIIKRGLTLQCVHHVRFNAKHNVGIRVF